MSKPTASRPPIPRPTPRASQKPSAPAPTPEAREVEKKIEQVETAAVAAKPDVKPPAPPVVTTTPPPPRPADSEPASGIRPAAVTTSLYANGGPVIREQKPALAIELADDDLVEEENVAPARPAMPPPPPPPVPLPVALASFDDVAARIVPTWEQEETCAAIADPTDLLFDVLYELNFVHTATNAATVCAEALARALGARAVLVHMHDVDQGDIRIIGVHGPRTMALVNTTEKIDDDLVGAPVSCNAKPVTMTFDGELPRSAPRRLRVIGVNRNLVAVPAMIWNRLVAMIEVIDPDERLASRAADAASYVAKRLAEYLIERAAA